MSLRKGATFHSPSTSPTSPAAHHIQIPSLPRRSQTTLEDVVEARKRRVALTLGDIDRGLSSVDPDSKSPATQSFRDESLPVPQGFLDHAVAAHRPDAHNGIMSDLLTREPADYNVGGRSLRPRRQTRAPSNHHASDSGLGSSIKSGSLKRSTSSGLTLVTDDQCAKSIVTASAITRSAAAHPSTIESLPRMSIRASNRIHEHILKPLLAKPSLKDFHPIVRDCPRRIHDKEIVCLRDLEKTLVFMAPVSDICFDVEGEVAYWFLRCLKERSKTAKLYLDFCLTSIRCIQATVEFLNEREQTRPHDRPYTNGYFVDLVDQLKNYAQQVQASKEKEAKGEELDEMDAESYVTPCKPRSSFRHGEALEIRPHHMTHNMLSPKPSTHLLKEPAANCFPHRSDEVKLYGGLNRNGRPAELVRVKKNGKAISIATGEQIKIESIEDDEKGSMQMKRSMSEEAANDESILRSMARRKRSASAAELAPKRCREPGCPKEFKRSCDLTKHEKTHSRPWKCAEKSCKYHEYGWPTEKELDRHINDKHSASPVLYKCHYAPCPYKSKRESNCKQHMEKSHGWNYVRSKNNGKNKSKAGDSSLPTPQTSNHRTPESDSHDEPTPEEDDYEMSEGYTRINFNENVYGDQPDYPEYPHDDFMMDGTNSLQPFISPVESHNQHQSVHSSEHPSPFLVNTSSAFQMDNVQANFGPSFSNGPDFTLYEEDIYNAHARVQLPTPSNSIFRQTLDLDSFMAPPVKAEPVPHISPRGQGNTMLYTPTSLGAVDESFEHFDSTDNSLGHDFQLFSNANANMLSANTHNGDNMFGEAPSAVGGFSQSNTQEFFAAFYNANTTAGTEWMQPDEGYSGAFNDHLIQ
jgi:hypothetical protein